MKDFKQVEIAKERYISYAEYGDPKGKPVLYFHGWPGFRMEMDLLEEDAKKFNLNLLAVDRPGYKGSTYVEDRTILDWASDMQAFLTELEIEKPHLIGTSGGCPYALACTYKIPELFDKVMIISGLPELKYLNKNEKSPHMRLFLHYGSKNPLLIKGFFKAFFWEIRRFPNLSIKMAKKFNQTDLNKQEYSNQLAEIFIQQYSKANDTNVEAVVKDAKLYTQDWGFDISEIKKEIIFWHGTNDKICPLAGTQKLMDKIENKKIHIVEAGHFLITKEQERIFSELCS